MSRHESKQQGDGRKRRERSPDPTGARDSSSSIPRTTPAEQIGSTARRPSTAAQDLQNQVPHYQTNSTRHTNRAPPEEESIQSDDDRDDDQGPSRQYNQSALFPRRPPANRQISLPQGAQAHAAPAQDAPRLSRLQESFLAYSPLRDIEQWLERIDRYPHFFDDERDGDVFLVEATEALAKNENQRHKFCLEKVALFRLAGGRSDKTQEKLFRDVYNKRGPAYEDFVTYLRQFQEVCRKRVDNAKRTKSPTQGVSSSDSMQKITTGLGHLSTSPPANRHGVAGHAPVSKISQMDSTRRHGTDNSTALQPERGGGIAVPRVSGKVVKSPTIRGSEGGEVEKLDDRFIRRESKRAGTFFRVGRVFAIITHAEHGNPNDTATNARWVTREGNLTIFSHVNRFAVVREGHGFCLAVPINTYNGQGTLKSGLRDVLIQAHAIIHDSERRPQLLQGEDLSKNPIAVDRAEDAEPLDRASRINFLKITSIEHNVRAMAVGKVAEKSRRDFEYYWRQNLLDGP